MNRLAAEYLEYFKQMEEKFGIENDVRVSALSRYPESIYNGRAAVRMTDELWKGLKKALDGAVARICRLQGLQRENI